MNLRATLQGVPLLDLGSVERKETAGVCSILSVGIQILHRPFHRAKPTPNGGENRRGQAWGFSLSNVSHYLSGEKRLA
jgi:hypothetical protein